MNVYTIASEILYSEIEWTYLQRLLESLVSLAEYFYMVMVRSVKRVCWDKRLST
jgi:hypothetical protein